MVPVKSDALVVRTRSAAVRNGDLGLAGAKAEVTRLRLSLEGTWRGLELEGGDRLVPRLEIGVRYDGGDAGNGFGLDVGGGLVWSAPARGLRAEAHARGLLTDEVKGFRELGFSGSLVWRPERGRGPSLTLRQSLGASAGGGVNALLERETLSGLAANDNGGGRLGNGRLEVRLGYGFAALEDRFTSTPELGFGLSRSHREYTAGWRLALAQGGPAALEFLLEAVRREAPNDNGRAEHGIGLRLTARW